MLLPLNYAAKSFLIVSLIGLASWAQEPDISKPDTPKEEAVAESSIEENIEASAEEETAPVSVRLREKGTRTPIAQANVFALPSKQKAVTNEEGLARFEGLPVGPVQLVVNVTGYERLDKPLTLTRDTKTQNLYLLKQADYVFETRVVDNLKKRDGSSRTLGQEEFISAIGARGDPLVALENEAGFAQSGDGDLILQGADPEDTRFTVNGHEVPLIFHFLGFSSVFIPDVVDRVSYNAAGFGSEFGRSIGGNVGLYTKAPKDDRLHLMSYVDILNSAALIQAPISKNQSFWLGGRISYLGYVLNAVASQEENTSFRTAPRFYDVEAAYNWKINNDLNFDILGIAASDELELFTQDAEDPFFKGNFGIETKFYRVIPRLAYETEKRGFEFSVGFGRDDFSFFVDDQFFDNETYKITVRSEWRERWSEVFESFVGIDTTHSFFDISVDFPSSFIQNERTENETPLALSDNIQGDINDTFHALGSYLRGNLYFGESLSGNKRRWLFSPNLRFDYFSSTDQFHVQPRGELRFQVSKQVSLRAASGLYYQEPQPQEIDGTFGNGNLENEKATHYVLGVDLDYRNAQNQGVWGDFQAFYKNLDHLVVNSNELVSRNGELVPERYTNDGSGNIWGGQWNFRYRTGPWLLGLAYTLSWSRRDEPGLGTLPSFGDRRHNINVRGALKLKKWTFSSRVRLISGSPYTPVVNASYDIDNDVFRPVQGDLLSERLPYFIQWDARIDRKWVFNQWLLSLYLDVQNVTNRENINEVEYNFDFTEERSEAGIPILPAFGVKGEF